MVSFKLVEAREADIPKIQQIAEEIWIPTFSRIFSGPELQQLFQGMYAKNVLAETLKNPNYNLFFICDERNKEIGYCAVERKRNVLKLDKIYVAPAKQGGGFGRAVMKEIYQMADAQGLSLVELRVNRAHEKSISFYQKQGFKIVESVNFPAPNGYIYEDYIMQKRF